MKDRDLSSILINILLLFLGIILVAKTFIFAAVPLKALKQNTTNFVYWSLCFITSIGLLINGSNDFVLLGISFMCMAFMIGIYSNLSEKGYSLGLSSIVSVALTSSVLGGSFFLIKSRLDELFLVEFKEVLNKFIASSEALVEASKSPAFVNDIMAQIPSGVVMALIFALAFALILEKKISQWFRRPLSFPQALDSFKVPDVFVWIFIACLLGSFLKVEGSDLTLARTVSINVLNVLVLLYFFQGFSILLYFFKANKVSLFWRTFWSFVFIFQLFFVLSFIGLSDFWLNYRARIARKMVLIKSND